LLCSAKKKGGKEKFHRHPHINSSFQSLIVPTLQLSVSHRTDPHS
jgi:hypothetical protein